MRMTRLDVEWLFNLNMNPIATSQMLKAIFEYNLRNVIVRAQKTVSTEYKKMWHFGGP